MVQSKISFDDSLGDIDSVLHNQSVSDLSWLAVDEATYRALETLPKQNLDIIPELTRALAVDPADDIQKVIPLKPHTIVNQNPSQNTYDPVDYVNPIRNRVASYITSGLPSEDIKTKLLLEFPEDAIRAASSDIKAIVAERGLLGNVYINSNFINKCDQESNKERKNIVACSKRALYVIGKPQCNNCVKNINGRCASLQKQIVNEVPYGPKLAAHYVDYLVNSRQATSLDDINSTWKERIQNSFLSKNFKNPEGIKTIQTREAAKPYKASSSDINAFLSRKPESVTHLSAAYTKHAKRMMAGKNDVDLLLASGQEDLVRLASEYGLLGHYYLDMDALGGCNHTEKFIKDHNLNPFHVVRREAHCTICKNLPDGACARICKSSKISSSLPTIDRSAFLQVLNVKHEAGLISSEKMRAASTRLASDLDYRSLTAQLYTYKGQKKSATYKEASIKGHYISPASTQKRSVDPEEIRMFISHLMNTGLKGSGLTDAISNRYAASDLKGHAEMGRRFAAEEGLQGSYYLDPTAYRDYGHGCQEGAFLFKNKSPRHIMASSSCTGCTMQTAPGWCSKYCKDLIRSVPKSVRNASKRSLPVIQTATVENPVEKYELGYEFDVSPVNTKKSTVDMNLPGPSLDQ
jgi:hypothetical protein